MVNDSNEITQASIIPIPEGMTAIIDTAFEGKNNLKFNPAVYCEKPGTENAYYVMGVGYGSYNSTYTINKTFTYKDRYMKLLLKKKDNNGKFDVTLNNVNILSYDTTVKHDDYIEVILDLSNAPKDRSSSLVFKMSKASTSGSNAYVYIKEMGIFSDSYKLTDTAPIKIAPPALFGYEGGYETSDGGIMTEDKGVLIENFREPTLRLPFAGVKFTKANVLGVDCGYIGTTINSTQRCTLDVTVVSSDAYIEFDYYMSAYSTDTGSFFIGTNEVKKMYTTTAETGFRTFRHSLSKGKNTLKWQYKSTGTTGTLFDSKLYISNIRIKVDEPQASEMKIVSNLCDFTDLKPTEPIKISFKEDNDGVEKVLIASADFWKSYVVVKNMAINEALAGQEDVMFAVIYKKEAKESYACFKELKISKTTEIFNNTPVDKRYDTTRKSHLIPQVIDLDINDFDSRNNYNFYNHEIVYISSEGKYGVTFKNDSDIELGGDTCESEWSKNNIEYLWPNNPTEEQEAIYEQDENHDWNYSLVLQRNWHYTRKISFTTNFSSSGADVLEMSIDARIADGDIWNNEIWVSHNGSEMRRLEFYGNGGYENNYIQFYNGINWGDTITLEFRNNQWTGDDAKCYFRNIRFIERRWGSNEVSIVKKNPVDVSLIKEGKFKYIRDMYHTSNNAEIFLRLSTNKNMSNPIDIKDVKAYDLPADSMYASIMMIRRNQSNFDKLMHFRIEAAEPIEPPTENYPVEFVSDLKRSVTKPASLIADTDREIIGSYHFDLNYDYLIDNPDYFKLSTMKVDKENKTFSMSVAGNSIVASHDMKNDKSTINIDYYNVLPYDDNKEVHTASDMIYSSEYDNWIGKNNNYGAIALPELHRLYGMMVISGLDITKTTTAKFRVKVATVGDLVEGEADFVYVTTDSLDTPMAIRCTNFYQEVNVTISAADIWEDGTARIYFDYNNFHFGNFVDVEVRLADIQVEQTTGHGLYMIFQSANKIPTTSFKEKGADFVWDVNMSDGCAKYVGFTKEANTNVYPSNNIIFGQSEQPKNTRLFMKEKIDYHLTEGVALDDSCPDEAYLNVIFERPADLSKDVVFKSLKLRETDGAFKKDATKKIDTQKSAIANHDIQIDTHRELKAPVDIAVDVSREVMTEDMMYKDAPVLHASVLEYLKVSGELSKQTNLIKISTNKNKVKRMKLKVYRRQDTVWQTANTSKVYAKYKFYDANKKAITEFIDVPAGTLVSSQYVLVDIDVPKNAKYMNFDLYMINPASTKEHRIKINIESINIDNLTMGLLMANPTVKRTYSEASPYWIHQYGSYSSYGFKIGKVKVDADNVHMALGSSTFTSYDSMKATNVMDVDGTSGYAYVKSFNKTHEDTVVWIDEGTSKIPVELKADTSRQFTSDITDRWISSHLNSYFLNVSSTTTNGITSIPEDEIHYQLKPADMNNLSVSKLEVVAFRQVEKTYFGDDYEAGANTYMRISYSVDNGKTYKKLVTTRENNFKAVIDIPKGITKVHFKYSAKNIANESMSIYIMASRQEVFHKRLNFFSNFTKDMHESVEKVKIGAYIWKKYTITPSCDFNTPSDINIAFPGYDNQIKVSYFDENGVEIIADGRKALGYRPNYHWWEFYVYVREDSGVSPTSVYLTTVQNKAVEILSDTLRKASGKLLSFIFDSNRKAVNTNKINSDTYRKTNKEDNIMGGSERLVIKNIYNNSDLSRLTANHVAIQSDTVKKSILDKVLASDLLRRLNNSLSNKIDTHRHTISTSNKEFESTREVISNTKADLDTLRAYVVKDSTKAKTIRSLIKKAKVYADTSRLLNANHMLVLTDTLRKLNISNTTNHDSTKQIAKDNNILSDSTRAINKASNILSNTLKKVAKNTNTVSDATRKTIKKDKASYDSNRLKAVNASLKANTSKRMVRTDEIIADTVRRVRMISNTALAIAVEVKRIVVKDVAIQSDTKRFMGFPYERVADLFRKTVHGGLHVYDTHKITHKEADIEVDTKKETTVSDIGKFDTQRSVYWRLYSKTSYDLLRQSIKEASITNDSYRCCVANEEVIADTVRDLFYQVALDMRVDTQRETILDYEFVSDTDRLPFYFVNMKAEAKRSHVYHKKAFLFDTSRDKYVVDMTRVSYDTLRAVKVINPYAKVYEYNIKVCNSLLFNIKM